MAQPPPDLKIPSSKSTVSVRIIDTTSWIKGIPAAGFFSPDIKGFAHLVLFDLGVRKDIENFAPRIANRIKDGGWSVTVQQGVRTQLEANGVPASSIEAIICTALVVGPNFKSSFIPGFPSNKDSPIRESDYSGRELREISFEENRGFKIGNFNAYDYFGDGSFYLLDSPGHAIGHMCALARVSSQGKEAFIFMGGDACHHVGEFRPSPYLPLPSHITPNPMYSTSATPCPGSIFEHLLRDGDTQKPFYEIARLPDGKGIAHDVDEAQRTIGKVIEADARDDILVVMAHDETLVGVVDFFPKYADGFYEKGWVEKGRWLFLRDFKHALEDEGAEK
ncbi:hypothetical protein G7Y89_g9145 [Cudoniella acicularis]|uniref:Uncharacterized protein n=1 Tax=Cudoniella acicularis TaxID=354080 RepID=A0A8H4RIY1_9HELO|nr:hypothetical protein G7Y89_g9145 [Cudoniella acicularis]